MANAEVAGVVVYEVVEFKMSNIGTSQTIVPSYKKSYEIAKILSDQFRLRTKSRVVFSNGCRFVEKGYQCVASQWLWQYEVVQLLRCSSTLFEDSSPIQIAEGSSSLGNDFLHTVDDSKKPRDLLSKHILQECVNLYDRFPAVQSKRCQIAFLQQVLLESYSV